MERMRPAGLLWLGAAGLGIAMALIFRTDPGQWLITLAIGVMAAVVGLLLMVRPSTGVVSASNILVAGWTVLYTVLAVQQSGELAAWTTDIALVAVGLAAGLVTYRTARANLRGSIS